MSRQLHISSLFSALALIALCMVAAVKEVQASDPEAQDALVQAEVSSGLQG